MKNRVYIFISVSGAIVYWFMDSFIHRFVYKEERFELIPSDFNELWMRILVFVLIISIGIISGYYARRLQEKEQEKQDVYKTTVNEATQILRSFLHEIHYFESEAERIGGFDNRTLTNLEGALRKAQYRLDALINVGDVTAENIKMSAGTSNQ